jgi:hypothetical protein
MQSIEGDDQMVSIGKRAAGIGAAVAMIATAGPVSVAGAATTPAAVVAPATPLSGAYQAGLTAAVGGWNAGNDAAVGGWNAGLAALGMPFQLKVRTGGPFGANTAGFSPLTP